MIEKILYGLLIIAEVLVLSWIMLSFVDFWHHDLARNLDLWLGEANFVQIICTIKN